MEETKYMKNFIKRYFSYKLLFVYFVYVFLLITAIFTRSFLGISLFGFRIGELIIGFALILTLYFFFFPKPSVYFDFGSRKFFFVHKVIVLYVLLRLILNFENIDLYQFKSSSFIWTISIIYFGIFVSSLYRQNMLAILGFSLAPIFVYIFQTGNYPNFLINIFQNYSDKFQFMKAADMVIITIVSSLYLKQSQNNKILSVIYTNFLCFLFLPLLAINSRGAVLGVILFLVIENLNNGENVIFDIDWQGTEQIKNKKLNYKLITFFILPPSKNELFNRLRNRDMKDKNIVEQRMKQFNEDINRWESYDFVVINDDLDRCYKEIVMGGVSEIIV